MGWGYCGKDSLSRSIGYSIRAKCDKPNCGAKIDRGLSYVCGGMHGGDGIGCGRYFCGKHLVYVKSKLEARVVQVCDECYETCMKDPDSYCDPFADIPENGATK